jgi:hypothetical protein
MTFSLLLNVQYIYVSLQFIKRLIVKSQATSLEIYVNAEAKFNGFIEGSIPEFY